MELSFESSDPRIHYGDERAFFGLMREVRQVRIVARFTVDGEPASKARARFTKRGNKMVAYTPDKTKAAEQKVAWQFRRAAPGHKPDPEATYGVCAVFFAGTRQRRDVDNMIKLVCDGLNGVAWPDDVQVEEVSGRRGYDLPENARTEVLIYEVGSHRRSRAKCEWCGESYKTYPSWTNKRHCSIGCRMAADKAARTVNCAHCGKPFDKGKSGSEAKFCSMRCVSHAKTVEITCSGCGSTFRRPRSTAAQQKNKLCDGCKGAEKERRKTECINGHLWAYHAGYRSNGTRYCRECRHEAYERTKDGGKSASPNLTLTITPTEGDQP